MFYLGHEVSQEGVATDPAKINQVAQWPVPQSTKDVQKFLGLASYYRRFVCNFASIARPLHLLTEKTTTFEWTVECQISSARMRITINLRSVLYPCGTQWLTLTDTFISVVKPALPVEVVLCLQLPCKV